MNELKFLNVYSSAYVYALLRNQGCRPVVSSAVLGAAFELLSPPDREEVIHKAKEFFRSKAAMLPIGLETLPLGWLATLPDILWRTRKPHWDRLPYMIRELKIENGVLCMKFAQELPTFGDRITAWDRLRIQTNIALRPNLWTPLTTDVEQLIWEKRPDLRLKLFTLPR